MVCSTVTDLRWIGIRVNVQAKQASNNIGECEEQDHLVRAACHLAMSLVGMRLIRWAHVLWSWSSRSLLFLHENPTVVSRELARMKSIPIKKPPPTGLTVSS